MGWKDNNREMRARLRNLNKNIAETSTGFGAMAKAAKAGGTLDEKTKEFIALAIAVADRCDPCIGFHVEALVRLKATREEIAGVLEMCVYMGGGPSLMYASKAMECYDELAA